jgi:protein-disulfide isomerase
MVILASGGFLGILQAKVFAMARALSFLAALVGCSPVPAGSNLKDTSTEAPFSGAANTGAANTSEVAAGAFAKVPVGTSPIRGPSDAWVTVIEFGDFECPPCGAEEPVLQALLAERPNDLRLVFKNFPLTKIHPFAQGAAVAAECAAAQGAFWPMHDLLFSNQDALQSENLPTYAQSADLNVPAWQECVSTQPPLDAIAADVALGNAIGLRGTPTLVVNGVSFEGALRRSKLDAIVAEAMARAQASGVSSSQYYDSVILSH